jgi:hypothetical protein
MKSIYIHAGLHKTGTTSVQSIARNNHDPLKVLGVYSPPLGERYGNAIGGLHSIPREIESQSQEQLDAPRGEGSLFHLLEEFEKSELKTLFISSEGFARFGGAEMIRLSSQLRVYRVIPILVFRHPIAYRISRMCTRGNQTKTVKRNNYLSYFLSARNQYSFGTQAKLWKQYFPDAIFLKYENYSDITTPIFDKVTGGGADTLARGKRRRESLPVDLTMLHHELRNVLSIRDELYRSRIYNNLFTMQDSPRYQSYRKGLGERLLPIGKRQQEKVLENLREEIVMLSSVIGESCEDYLLPLEGHVVGKAQLNRLMAMFARLFISAGEEVPL